ncbi:MAG: glycosyltransferase family 2 protein [Paludibacteraceae bacterium]|nr:glycosyltransferase family 2 protein [Paludibacteraceae bacterium]
MKQDKPLVAIKCLVYNHEPYLRDCLEGFVMQQTNFPFVAIVHDDASTDNSAAIIREYEEKYPDIIQPIYEAENQYSKQDGSLGRIMNAAIDATGAKYVAMCEGDDYWIDPLKLQKQVDFLQMNPKYSMCFHGARVINELSYHEEYAFTNINEKDYTDVELFTHWIVPTASIVYKKNIVQNYSITHAEWMITGDVCLVIRCASVGKVKAFSDIMSVYRLHVSSVVHSEQYAHDKIMKLPEHYLSFYYSFPNLKNELLWLLAQAYYTRFRNGKTNTVKKILDLLMSIYYQPSFVFHKVKKSLYKIFGI